jgi:predicted aspartyl protease
MNAKLIKGICVLLSAFSGGYVATGFAQNAIEIASETPIAIAAPIQQEYTVDRSLRMTVAVRINESAEYPFVVDTGAERTVISNELAKILALKQGEKLRLATISGPANVNSFIVDRLTTSTISLENFTAPGLDRDHLGAFGLLGIDSLQNKKIDIDNRLGKMTVASSQTKNASGRLESGMIVVTAKSKGGRLILSDAKINGFKVDIIIDTGAQNSLGNQKLRDVLLRRNRKGGFSEVMFQSVTGERMIGDFTQIKAIEIGGIEIGDLPITFSENYAMKALNLNKRPAIFLGMDALQLFDRVIIDFARKRVSFGLPKGARRSEPARMAQSELGRTMAAIQR